MSHPEFASAAEFREVIDRTFTLLSGDLVFDVRAARDGEEGCLHWEWSEDAGWEPKVTMTMSSATANRYFQGKENIAMAIARRRIKAGGDVRSALALIPITKPLEELYREMIEADFPHLAV